MALPEAVNVFFDRMSTTLPEYVSPTPALLFAILITSVLLLLLRPTVEKQRKIAMASDATADQLTHILSVTMLGALGLVLVGGIRDKIFNFQMIVANKQHFANVHWVHEYAQAMVPSLSLFSD
jgi:low affinity Fe/Cu permease